jgi:hypothetical protein
MPAITILPADNIMIMKQYATPIYSRIFSGRFYPPENGREVLPGFISALMISILASP